MKRWFASRCRGRLALAAALVAVVFAFFAPVVFAGRVFFLKDAELVVYPIRILLRERWLAGDLAEWLPELDLGMPFLANPSHGVLYPLNVVLLLPAPWSIGFFIVLHSALAAVSAWFLLRELRTSSAAALVGALGFGLGGYMVSLTWIANYMMSLAWLPLVAWCSLRVLRTGRLFHVVTTGVALALQVLSGEPQGVFLTGWLVLAFALSYPLPRKLRLRRGGLLALALLLAACIAMPQILPTLDLLPRSRRAAGIDLAQASHWSLHPWRLVELVFPWGFGNPIHFDEFLGYFMDDEGGAFHRDPWIATPYFGSLAAVSAIVGVAFAKRRHLWWTRSLVVLSVLTLFIALGQHTPVFGVYFQWVPGAKLFRYPAKFFGLLAATLPFLAAAGIDAWRTERSANVGFVVGGALLVALGAAGFVAAPTLGTALHELRPEVPVDLAKSIVSEAVLRELTLVVLVLGALIGARRYAPGWVPAVLVFGFGTQILCATWRAYETADPATFSAPPEIATRILGTTPRGGVPRVMHAMPAIDAPGFDSLPGPERARELGTTLMKNVGIAFGISYTQAYVSSEEGEKWLLWSEAAAWQRQLLDAYSVHHLIVSALMPIGPEAGLEKLMELPAVGAAVYRNPRALPFAFVVPEVLLAPDVHAALRAVAAPQLASGALAVVEDYEAPDPLARPVPGPMGSCELRAPPSDDVLVTCTLDRPGWVVVNESHHPHWRAWTSGVEVPIHRANAMVMAVPIPAGRHDITFSYREPSLPFGLAIGFLALLVCLLVIVRERSALF